ncbi:hypothetical protein PR003_g17244 [Phytophthora rubi]|uniref:Uncharacterized protein n=1 Tax=Phytophthora rubi TaxID=129364 RepID=A0A6A4EA03_9STRA|nr:hypothetical protein PR002_g16320 [Phytophthora rubi]KAE9322405.1 hypothetical protein PR003_g17244 [Phytophthora rubi]
MRCHAAFWAFVQQHGTPHAAMIATQRDEDVARTTKWLLNRQGKHLRTAWLALSPANRQELMDATPDPSFPATENGIYDDRQGRTIRLHSARQASSNTSATSRIDTSATCGIDTSAQAETSFISSATSLTSTEDRMQYSRGEQVTDDLSAELSVSLAENEEMLSSTEALAPERRSKRRKKLVTRSRKTQNQAPNESRQRNVTDLEIERAGQVAAEVPRAHQSHSQREELSLSDTTHERSQRAEVDGYELALSARGWRAQLLKDVDLHLLRAVAEIASCLETTEASSADGQLNSSEGAERDSTQALRELETAASRVQVAQRRLSSMVAATIAQAESLSGARGAKAVHGINTPRFVSTGEGSLVLMSDIERYLLLMGEAVRRYRRAKASISQSGSSAASGQAGEVVDLWPLQLHIEGLMAELKELSASIYDQAKRRLTATWSHSLLS